MLRIGYFVLEFKNLTCFCEDSEITYNHENYDYNEIKRRLYNCH